ncbi:uncharacterized protein AMSG_06165 [Thecamonas trahens ATCC 50062]|uniref:F-box domain-containing protein n=1 Tax=Thecamonas trahens ATCC 50062 TaxID=461836 RepID=A0A0L0DC01_THETB|nr:hypothetical protein AMSG_06165 [Thecamonas trahens ATCC 50062]KNC49872.1 hypothetical protein AMSG_06165 [Thecamonas trahens ATCC 50062]|eukprot:XP_013757356.1 hypothetical protein AMSG_06165 [Thecamonas trahens ATCC 50062]
MASDVTEWAARTLPLPRLLEALLEAVPQVVPGGLAERSYAEDGSVSYTFTLPAVDASAWMPLPPPTLVDLPVEILVAIMAELGPRDRARAGRSCRALRAAATGYPGLWRVLSLPEMINGDAHGRPDATLWALARSPLLAHVRVLDLVDLSNASDDALAAVISGTLVEHGAVPSRISLHGCDQAGNACAAALARHTAPDRIIGLVLSRTAFSDAALVRLASAWSELERLEAFDISFAPRATCSGVAALINAATTPVLAVLALDRIELTALHVWQLPPTVTSLSLAHARLSPSMELSECSEWLGQMPALRNLVVDRAGFVDEAWLTSFVGPRLAPWTELGRLSLSGCPRLTPAMVSTAWSSALANEAVTPLPALTAVDLSRTAVDDSDVWAIAEAAGTTLTSLNVSCCTDVTGDRSARAGGISR